VKRNYMPYYNRRTAEINKNNHLNKQESTTQVLSLLFTRDTKRRKIHTITGSHQGQSLQTNWPSQITTPQRKHIPLKIYCTPFTMCHPSSSRHT
ncbi:Hypothetical predicted protein, partial [Pelobates cultripes]